MMAVKHARIMFARPVKKVISSRMGNAYYAKPKWTVAKSVTICSLVRFATAWDSSLIQRPIVVTAMTNKDSNGIARSMNVSVRRILTISC